MLYVLAIHSTLFLVDSLLLTKDMLCRKLPIACKVNQLLNQQAD